MREFHAQAFAEDPLAERFTAPWMLTAASRLLEADDQSEEEFLGAQGVLLLNGLI